MTASKYSIILQIEELISLNNPVSRDLFAELGVKASDKSFLEDFDPLQFQVLITKIFFNLTNLQDQLDTIRTISNILLLNESLRSTTDQNIVSALNGSIPNLKNLLDQVSERQINSESQYKDYLPIFRLFFLLTHNNLVVPNLKDSIIKTSKKLLNFVSLSSSESQNLNIIIIEILKIIYSYVHQVEDMTGIDSSFVLSFNKFQLLYSKSTPNNAYDEILQHFGNVLMAINPEISNNYMINSLKFVENEVSFVNRLVANPEFITRHNILTNCLLALQVTINIDSENKVRDYINGNLNIMGLESLTLVDPNSLVVFNQLKLHLSSPKVENPPQQESKESKGLNGFEKIIKDAVSTSKKDNIDNNENKNVPRFEDLTAEEQEKELDEINEIFDKIERNGVFKLQMK